MQNLKEGDSVVVDSDSFDINGKVGEIRSVNLAMNRCVVVVEGATYHLPLHAVSPRRFLTES